MLARVLVALAATVAADNVKIGELKTLQHGVSGEVWALDESKLTVKNFNYDGTGPDAFFWVGTEGTPKSPGDESKTAILAHPFKGVHYEYRNLDAPLLGASTNEQVTLTLPPHMKVSDLKWLSVWCRRASADFGSLTFSPKPHGGSTNTNTNTNANADANPNVSASTNANASGNPIFGLLASLIVALLLAIAL